MEKGQKIEAKSTIHAIVHHSFPARLNLLFAFDYQPSTGINFVNTDVSLFYCVEISCRCTMRMSYVYQKTMSPASKYEDLTRPVTGNSCCTNRMHEDSASCIVTTTLKRVKGN